MYYIIHGETDSSDAARRYIIIYYAVAREPADERPRNVVSLVAQGLDHETRNVVW